MELQFEKRVLSCLVQALRATKDQELTQEVRLPESLPDVGRVLAGWGQVVLRGKEWQGSHLAAAGGVQASVLYAPEDGTEPRCVETWIPFQMKWDGAEADREGVMRVLPLLQFVDGRNLSARKILIRAGISCLAEGLAGGREAVYSPGEVPEDVELLRRSYPMRLPREAGEKPFELEQTLSPGENPVQEIISYTLHPELTEGKVSGDKLVLRGNGTLHLVYRCREGRIRTRDFEVPFSQLAQLEREYADDPQADVLMAVTSLELDMEEDNLLLRCGLTAQYQVSDRTMLELVEDAYSPRREVAIRQEELRLPVILDESRERISARADFPDSPMETVDGVFWPGFSKQRREGDRVELTMPGRFQMLGYGPDGRVLAATAPWEGSRELAADPASRIDAVTEPASAVQRLTGGMELRAEMGLHLMTRARQGLPMITGLELGPVRQEKEPGPSLILCRPGKRGLWEIAKGCGSSVDAIRQANALEGEPADNRMLLIPVQ